MPKESFEEFCARRTRRNAEPEPRTLPPEWDGRERKRVERHPPDFAAELEHARAWAEIHAGLWSPELRDVKRLEGGTAALLFRGRRGGSVMVVMRGGTVLRSGTEQQFRAREEVLQ